MRQEIYETSRIAPTISTDRLTKLLRSCADKGYEYIFLYLEGYDISMPQASRDRMIQVAEDTEATFLYADYRVREADGSFTPHPLTDYQWGSVRDDFDFGPVIRVRTDVLPPDGPYAEEGPRPSDHSGLYALRLFLAARDIESIVHLREPLYTASESDNRTSGEKQFDYVDPRNGAVQKERESIFTDYLRDIYACLPPSDRLINPEEGEFPTEASVIIPVRDRVRTIRDAVASALSQQTDFPFNVIVVDNHSTDGTTEALAELAADNPRIRHIIPEADNLGIGGCWNLGVADEACGRFAVQLDSDDRYKDHTTLQKIVDCFRREKCAMVIGSYELTDFDGNPLPPGLIDHREWTDDNGHNNALRVNGLGAPRAFFTPVLRKIGVPNVSYGEDYALGLRISRRYRIGRIYESLYSCRRWQGNSDANLSQERVNANNAYKDLLRSIEISARTKIVERQIERYRQHAARQRLRLEQFTGRQLECWPLLRENTEALQRVEEKLIPLGEADFCVFFNPARETSSAARVDAGSIAARPCFLCGENRPDCQEALDILPGYKLLVNPYPVFDPHFTIVSETHQPQALMSADSDGTPHCLAMFDLCGELPDKTVFYNGPKCGASAPDHLHFQAVDNADFPLFPARMYRTFPYLTYHFTATSRQELLDRLRSVVKEISQFPENAGEAEPRMNVFMTAAPGREGFFSPDNPAVEVVVIPRRAHRPGFYGTGEGEMLLSPGALDVSGSVITVRRDDFRNLDAATLEKALRETTYWLD